MLGLRADRVGELSAPPTSPASSSAVCTCSAPLSVEGLRAAIEGPARQAGLRSRTGSSSCSWARSRASPARCPSCPTSCAQTWQRREGRTLTVAGYRRHGGHARGRRPVGRGLFRGPTRATRRCCATCMLRLVTPGDRGATRAHAASRDGRGDRTPSNDLVDRLVGARLLSTDGDAVEIAHESLAVAWPRLRSWLDDDVDGQRVMRHLSVAAESWDALGRPESELYRGARQVRSAEWSQRTHPVLTDAEQDFLTASAALADRDFGPRRSRCAGSAASTAACGPVSSRPSSWLSSRRPPVCWRRRSHDGRMPLSHVESDERQGGAEAPRRAEVQGVEGAGSGLLGDGGGELAGGRIEFDDGECGEVGGERSPAGAAAPCPRAAGRGCGAPRRPCDGR